MAERTCRNCRGTGKVTPAKSTKTKKCHKCGGTGKQSK